MIDILTVYTLEQAEQWDKTVLSFKDYDVYWLSGYVKAFKIHGDGEPLLFSYTGNAAKAINVVMKRKINDDVYFKEMIGEADPYFDFTTPYGYGGWLIEGDDTEQIFSEYDQWCKKNNIVSEFVRFHPIIKNHTGCNKFYEIVRLGEVVHIDLSSPEVIWGNIISKNRNMIRKAEKNNVKIYNGRFPEIYENFSFVYNETMDKDNADKYYYFEKDFYTSVLEDLPQNAQIFYAVKDNIVIAASIMISANKKMNYHLSGSLKEYSSLAATNLLLYKAALWGCANGYSTLYLGGGVGSSEDGLFKFKKSFYKGDLNHYYIGKKIFNKEKYNELVVLRKNIKDKNFFPQYRG